MVLAVLLPLVGAMLLLVALTVGFGKGGKPTGVGILVLVVGLLAVVGAMFYLMFRFLYLNIVVARREPQPLKTSFHETRGKIWKISCALFLPWTAIVAVTIPVELLGPVLERNLGFVGLAPWFLFDAGLTGFLGCLGAAVLAFSYQRLIVSGAATGPADAAFAPQPPPPPAATPPGNPSDSAGSGIKPMAANLSTSAPEQLPTSTTFSASSAAGMASTHCRVRERALKLWFRPLSTQPMSGGTNSIMVCQVMVMTLARPL